MNRDEMTLERPTTGGRAVQRGRSWRNVLWIVHIELARTWPSYLVAALLTPFIGLLCLSLLWSSLESISNIEGVPARFMADWIFLLMMVNLGINWTSPRWTYVHRDPFTTWLSFLKTLPVSNRGLILGRMAVMLAATVVMTLVFFLPTYVLFPALRNELPPLQYLWFVLFWIGYVLFSGGALLYLELGVRGKATLVILFVWSLLLTSAAVVATVLGVPLVNGSVGLVESYGPLPAVAALAVGGGGFLMWCRLLERRLERRELPS